MSWASSAGTVPPIPLLQPGQTGTPLAGPPPGISLPGSQMSGVYYPPGFLPGMLQDLVQDS
jgi:hypothetical protein